MSSSPSPIGERPFETPAAVVTQQWPRHSFPKNKIRILLLENVHAAAVKRFQDEGFDVVVKKESLEEEELVALIGDVHVLGIRSKTNVTERVLAAGRRLLCVACFCIGTNQVDLEAAQRHGIPVWNSPFCNSRSVAELIIGQVISLARRLGDVNMKMHAGEWVKSSTGCFEIRGKTLGIVGYGHIGSQLSVMAEALGMRVIFTDVLPIMPLGNSTDVKSLNALLAAADFVTMHVPATPETEYMIKAEQIALMKKGAYLLNASRGNVVDLKAVADALRAGHLAGAYVDVFPEEPLGNTKDFQTELRGCPNTLMTPHIGGSTEEAQLAIGEEVSNNIVRFINEGRTQGAVNFPNLDVRLTPNCHRILNIHQNVPGVLRAINTIISEFNVRRQTLDTAGNIGYLIIDVEREASDDMKAAINALESNIKTRMLY